MFPQLNEALLHERVRDFHRAAEATRRVKLARRGQLEAAATVSHPVAAHPMGAHPVAALRSLTSASRGHVPARHAGGHAPRRAA